MWLAPAIVVGPLLAGEGIDPAFQATLAIPLVALFYGAPTDSLDEFVRACRIARKGHRKTP